MIRFWRLNEYAEGNLGLACTKDGLFLGRTPLIERRGKRFVVRERGSRLSGSLSAPIRVSERLTG
jgi:hypothetical protein